MTSSTLNTNATIIIEEALIISQLIIDKLLIIRSIDEENIIQTIHLLQQENHLHTNIYHLLTKSNRIPTNYLLYHQPLIIVISTK